ncbi:MAG: efflux RND transporter periplasmic adaptor subunit [Lysobacteraceae bacterium]
MTNPVKSRSLLRRRWPWFAAAALVVVVALVALRPPPPPRLLTAQVARGDIVRTVVATGTIEATDLVSVGAQASGQIRALKVTVGQKVRAGELIAEIDSTNQRNAVRSADAALANIRAQRAAQQASLLQAEAAWQRQQRMAVVEATSRADLDAARATRDAARAQLQALDAQIAQSLTSLDTARANRGYTRSVAPMDATVVAVVAKEGQTVNAVQSSPTIVKLASLDTMTVEAEISEADVIHVKPGLPVSFTILGDPDRRFRATLRDVKPAPESVSEDDSRGTTTTTQSSDQAVYYNGRFDVPNPDGVLRIGMTAEVDIELARAKGVLKVPFAALGDRAANGRYAVRVVDARGRAVVRQVRIGMNNRVDAEVLAGLAAGERVVIGEAAGAAPSSSVFPPRPPQVPGGP